MCGGVVGKCVVVGWGSVWWGGGEVCSGEVCGGVVLKCVVEWGEG